MPITLSERARDRATFSLVASFTDRAGTLVTPSAASYTLLDRYNQVVNNRDAVALPLGETASILLTPDDTDYAYGDLRRLVLDWTYDSDEGSGLTGREQVTFFVDDIQESVGGGPTPVAAATYYVDATLGSDASAGTSEAAPWRTIGRVNNQALNPGDSILLKRGEKWTGTTLTIDASGTSQQPITIGDYGNGAMPIIDGNNAANCIYAIGQSYIVLDSLELARGLDHGAKFDGCEQVTVIDCDMHGAGNDNLIFINGCSNCVVRRGTYHDAHVRVVGYLTSGIEITDGGSDFLLEDVECYGNAHCGITVHNHNAADPQGATNIPANVILSNANCHDNGTIGINIMNTEVTTALNMLIEGCRAEDNTEDGIRVAPSGAALTDLEYLSGVTISRCTVLRSGRYDIYVEADSVIVKRSVFARGARSTRLVKALGYQFLNNIVYTPVWNNFDPIYVDGARTDNLTIKNNIILTDESTARCIAVTAAVNPGTKTIDINYNLWPANTLALNRMHWNGVAYSFANWQLNSGQDANSPTPADPLFTDKATNDFTLQAGSPAIDAGTTIAGVTEGYLGTAPDCGYMEKA